MTLPVMPLSVLLVMRMQRWRERRAPSDFSDKVEADITDIRALVVRALRERVSYRKKYRRHT
jgi:hypothetical protein